MQGENIYIRRNVMKNKRFFMGILGFLLVFGLFWTGCDSPTSPKKDPITYVVIYNANGGTGVAPQVQAAVAGDSITVADKGSSLTAPAGRTFNGWNTAADGSGTSYAVGATLTLVDANVTLFAQWKLSDNAYTVTYNANGGGGTVPEQQIVIAGASFTVAGQGSLTAPTGKAFNGWNTNATGTGTAYTAGSSRTVSSNITLYAQWITSSGASYTVYYYANGAASGSPPSSQTVLDGTTFTVAGQGSLTAPAGTAFDGWNTSSYGTGTAYRAGSSQTVSSDIYLYAQWVTSSGASYTVTYSANGASGTVPSAQTALDGITIEIAGQGDLTYSGKAFNGWNTNSSGTGTTYPAGSLLTVNATITLYAQWIDSTGVTYTVSYNSNGGTGTVPYLTVSDGQTITLPGGSGFSYSGYTFGGWTAISTNGTYYYIGQSYTVSGNVTFYAVWDYTGGSTYTVTFNANGGTGTPPPSRLVGSTSSITLPSGSGLSRTGYTFAGWSTSSEPNETNTYTSGSSYSMYYSNVTFYAAWQVNSNTITFDTNGGSTVSSQTVNSGGTATLPSPAPTKDNFTFGGWYSDSELTSTYNFSTTVLTNITLYAKWNPVPTYTVTFDTNGGSTVETQTVNSGGIATRPATNPTKEGFIFVNWYSDSALTTVYSFATTVTANITLYANWLQPEPITMTIGFVPDAAPVITGPTIYNTNYVPIGNEDTPPSATITLADPSQYDSINWYIPGTGISESGGSITLSVGNTAYNAEGQHALTLEVIIKGVPYSRTINFTVAGTPPATNKSITILMYDSYGDGWNSAALRITVNGTYLSSNASIGSGYTNTYTFSVTTGDAVKISWVSGNYNNECSFIVYYSDVTPSPAFYSGSFSQGSVGPTSWNGTGALAYKVRQTLGSTSTGTELTSFTVQN
jgi:uncharacterized repeat protein (TIGR02543 family)